MVVVKLSRLSSKKHWKAEDHAVAIRGQDTVLPCVRLSVLVWRQKTQEHAISGCESLLLIMYNGRLEAHMLVMATHRWSRDGQAEASVQSSRHRHPQILSGPAVQPFGGHATGTKRNGGGATMTAIAINKIQHNWQSADPHTSHASTCRRNQHSEAP